MKQNQRFLLVLIYRSENTFIKKSIASPNYIEKNGAARLDPLEILDYCLKKLRLTLFR